ncbi:MAG TPA: aspartyl protease family protein [Phenylobacterium sp.]|jgi:tetratricopeptide (TPR) repeat protein/predicted aspartyl protease|uniref:aspartyl protease family protein n=1 Tax=Phenylobacterium sp. TaxID=1871053 RepID=UPI002D485806|nr:aspartyl protease family protein [Phenylobacterium sp.]HZZ66627.1 aspartyl protease family protein [Phenylobacterium sp.]
MTARLNAFILSILTFCAMGFSARAADDCKLTKLVDLPVTMAGLRPLISTKINGKDALFLVDSGAFYSLLTPAAVQKYQLKTMPAPPGFRLEGVGGEQSASLAMVQSFDYAGIPIKNIQFLVSRGGYGPGSVGLIGQNILGATDIEFDLANGVIRLFRAKDCEHSITAYWAAGKALSALTIEYQTPREPHIIAPAEINGHPIRVMFDSGASTSLLSRSAAARVGVTASSAGVEAAGIGGGIGSRELETSIASFQEFGIGDEIIKNARLKISNANLLGVDMLLGDDFFLSHRVMVARSQRKIYFTYNGGPVFRLGQNTTAQAAAAPDAGNAAPGSDKPAAEGGPKTADEFSRRGDAFAARRDYPSAIADFTHAIELEPNDPRHYRDRAMARLNNRQPVLAMADLSQTLKLKPDDLQALTMRGELYLSQKDVVAAQADFDAAMKLAPQDQEMPLRFAAAYARARLYEAAVSQFDAWIAAHPKHPLEPVALEGRCRARALWGKDLEAALADCDAAMKHTQRLSVLSENRALVLLRLGRYDEAIGEYDRALKLQPKSPWGLYGRGLAELKKGQTAAGEADTAAALAVAPAIARDAKSYGLAPDEPADKATASDKSPAATKP